MYTHKRSFGVSGMILASVLLIPAGVENSTPDLTAAPAEIHALSFDEVESANGLAMIAPAQPQATRFKAAVSRLRQAMVKVGAGNIPLSTSNVPCGIRNAIACVNPAKGARIYVHPKLNTYAFTKIVFVMAHEYAHIVSTVYKKYGSQYKTAAFKAFRGNYEVMADCMALAKLGYMMSGYKTKCTSTQRYYGGRIWRGLWT